jgi:GMP synthase (glutamine-hydrolysing)
MLKLMAGRKERLFKNKNFSSEEEYQNHVSNIQSENKLLNFNDRTCEVRNWLNYLKN